ncbi:hypothetical protein ZOD2009_17970 [Haladaptatus paucihalophilus DX253]|uniref:Tat (Twin-arginine translocation) pathway signal sequence n=1 Tax=Haladaptatus paucihalophilus DX253 TaxID=797209 RepID=E7QXQ5_HALPU|nr:twin-arginine translocation signal domain-containing protein [Haladaptatus paucihalophilus]EFW90606.1 hypothetical protein ZOD2009_17970 [Haladaptatus paucihalophilus DX253]SHL57420.1 Tat (twin-arginine translocation) pathway signal sequence [Haladaptatus paucihalophilus DX253]
MTVPDLSDDTTQPGDSNSTSRRRFLAGAAVTGSALALSSTAIAMQSSASVTFDDQTTGGTSVSVASATLPKGGFIAIHDDRLLDGKALESVIGVSDALDAGTHETVDVELFDVKGTEFDSKMLEEDATLIAMPHVDSNGNEEYEFVSSDGQTDGPYTADGEAVVDDAMVSIGMDSKPTADVCFRDQKSDGESVWVNRATLSDGGFVTIHDASLLDGKVFDSVIGVSGALDAGTHEDIEISLYEGVSGGDYEMSMLEGDATLIAMPHFDSDDNGSYDFLTSEGETDGPYTMDGKAVVDDAEITLSDGC